ncbi:MAG: hypothetical protein HC881_10515 [Leptolyngbyaceae cyanobacterium SL_7_1]|nr:hypothetical protein [Leptolyngbyaceae cyanobacterium SL_7_1]
MFKRCVHGIVAVTLAAPIAAVITGQAIASKDNFLVQNNSGEDIVELYVSASSRASWDTNLLGGDVLASGESTPVTFGDPSPQSCLYDIMAVFSNGQTVEDYQINVCSSPGYTFSGQ